MNDPTRYRFRDVWTVPAAAADAYRALRELVDYPHRWREVKTAVRLDEDRVALVDPPTWSGSRNAFEQDVIVRKPLLRRLGRIRASGEALQSRMDDAGTEDRHCADS